MATATNVLATQVYLLACRRTWPEVLAEDLLPVYQAGLKDPSVSGALAGSSQLPSPYVIAAWEWAFKAEILFGTQRMPALNSAPNPADWVNATIVQEAILTLLWWWDHQINHEADRDLRWFFEVLDESTAIRPWQPGPSAFDICHLLKSGSEERKAQFDLLQKEMALWDKGFSLESFFRREGRCLDDYVRDFQIFAVCRREGANFADAQRLLDPDPYERRIKLDRPDRKQARRSYRRARRLLGLSNQDIPPLAITSSS